jgi:hypothetical protein
MTTLNASSLQNTEYSGEAPLAPAHGYTTLAAAQIGDKVRLTKLFAGSIVYEAKMINAVLGAASTVKLGFEYVNGEAGGNDAAFVPATSTAAAARTEMQGKPVVLLYDAYIIATVGGAAATGALDAVLLHQARGV